MTHLPGLLLALLLPLWAGNAAAASCPRLSLEAERTSVGALLDKLGYQSSEAGFLLGQSKNRLHSFPLASRKATFRSCSRSALQASVYGCIGNGLPGIVRSLPDPSAVKTGDFWGRTRFVARELAFIGVFHSCRAGAREAFEE